MAKTVNIPPNTRWPHRDCVMDSINGLTAFKEISGSRPKTPALIIGASVFAAESVRTMSMISAASPRFGTYTTGSSSRRYC